jgi:hypothetical protein
VTARASNEFVDLAPLGLGLVDAPHQVDCRCREKREPDRLS